MNDGKGRTIDKAGNWFCPFHHNDKTPSLSVFQGNDGRLLYKCWNDSCAKTGVVDGEATASRRPYRRKQSRTTPEPPKPIAQRLDSTLTAVQEVLDSPGQDFLRACWRRGLTLDICRKYSVAFESWTFKKGLKEYDAWLLPVQDEGRTVAVKVHREFAASRSQPKAAWLPLGEYKAKHGFDALFPSPEAFAKDKPLILCPGELKALAVLASGFNATSRTIGENTAWRPAVLDKLKGRQIVILFDDDEAGRKFKDSVVRRLKYSCPSLKAITFGSTKDGKLDANDVAFAEGLDGLRQRIGELLAVAPELAEAKFNLDAFRTDLKAKMSEALDCPCGIFAFIGIVGCGKSVLSSGQINERTEERFAVIVPTHTLAQEYRQRTPLSIRLLAPRQMMKEKLFHCEHFAEVQNLGIKGFSYGARVCRHCASKDVCPSWTAKTKAKTERVLIMQHSHLRYASDWLKDRNAFIDEDSLKHLRWRETWTASDLDAFARMVRDNYKDFWTAVEPLVQPLPALQAGQSAKLPVLEDAVLEDWQKAVKSRCSSTAARNLLPILAKAPFVRRERDWKDYSGKVHEGEFWTVQGVLPDSKDKPLVILDATASKAAYEELFGKKLTYFPAAESLPCPASSVVQFMDGMYPAFSLVKNVAPEGKEPYYEATASLKRIVDNLDRIRQGRKLAWQDVGIVSLLKAVQPIRTLLPELPAENLLHYAALRGLNTLKDAKLVAVIGCQPCQPRDLAVQVATLFNLDEDIDALLAQAGYAKEYADTLDGSFAVQQPKFKDKRFETCWQMTVTAEVVQAIGRARPFEARTDKQLVLVFCNLALPMPTEPWTMDDYLEAQGLKPEASDLEARLENAVKKLLDAKADFGLDSLCQELGIEKASWLGHGEYRLAMKQAEQRLGLSRKAGHGKDRTGVLWTKAA